MPDDAKPATPAYKSFTVWGATLVGALQIAEQQGLVPSGTAEHVIQTAEIVGWWLVAVGVRRQLGPLVLR